MRRLIPALLTLAFLLPGCGRKDSATYSGIESGFIQSGIFTSDNGTEMTVAGNEQKYDIISARRVLVQYETRPATASGRIDIDLLALWEAGIPRPTPAETLPDSPEGNPVQVSDAWFGADYLNLLVSFEGKDPALHTFSVSYTADKDGIILRLTHDATQDTATGTQLLGVFLSIPVYDAVLAYEQAALSTGIKSPYPAPVLLQWTAQTLEGGPLTLYERKGTYTPPSTN